MPKIKEGRGIQIDSVCDSGDLTLSSRPKAYRPNKEISSSVRESPHPFTQALTPSSTLSSSPLPSLSSPRLHKKTLLLRQLVSSSVSDQTLNTLEMIEQLDRDQTLSSSPSESLQLAYRTVAIDLTARMLRDDNELGEFSNAVNRVRNCRAEGSESSEGKGLIVERLRVMRRLSLMRRIMEEAVESKALRNQLLKGETAKEAEEALVAYLKEAAKEMEGEIVLYKNYVLLLPGSLSRELKMWFDNAISDKLKMWFDSAISDVTPDNVNLTAEKGEGSRTVEAHAPSQVNINTVHVPYKISDVQNGEHQPQAVNLVEHDISSPTDKAVAVSPQSNDQHPTHSEGPSFCNVSKDQDMFNNE